MTSSLPHILIFLPLAAALGSLLFRSDAVKALRYYLITVLSVEMLAAIWVYVAYSDVAGVYGASHLQLRTQVEWFRLGLGAWGSIRAEYFVGVDGLNVALILLAGVVMWLAGIASLSITARVQGYIALYLLLTGAIMGSFLAQDMLLFYLFFEFMLLPMYFLIGIWGGERREYASIKFFIYTLIGSLLILIVMIGLCLSVIIPNMPVGQRVFTFNMFVMADGANFLPTSLLHIKGEAMLGGYSLRAWAFWALVIGFLIKLPAVPMHTWLPDAHVEAPTPVSMVLAGVLLKIGGYGLLRIAYPIFPEQALAFAPVLAGVAVLAIIYGALNALAMNDLKKMVAYSSVSHMGFVLLGIASLTAEGVSGAVFQMFSHGILSAMLFALVGVLYERTHQRGINQFRGLSQVMPAYAGFVCVGFFASLGLPGFSGFIGELFPLLGGFKTSAFAAYWAAVAVLGIVLSAAYFLWAYQRVWLGSLWCRETASAELLTDLNKREWLIMSVLTLMTTAAGIFPQWIFGSMQHTVQAWLKLFV